MPPTSPLIIIFDNDGTLVPSHEVANPAIQRAFARYCGKHGLDLPVPSDAHIRDLTGLPGEEFYRALLPDAHREHAASLRAACLDEEVDAVLREARFYPGLDKMLRDLKVKGTKLVLASHGGARYIGAMAQRLGYAMIFERIFHHGLDGLASKGEMAARAFRELGPADGLFVGDRRADRDAAREAGIPFVGCLYGYGAPEELEGSDHLAATPEELAELLLDGRLAV